MNSLFSPQSTDIDQLSLNSLHTSLVLLDNQNRIVGAHTASDSITPALQPGADFFSLFPTNERELVALERSRAQADTSLLMRAGDRPMLMLCHTYFCTGLTPVLLPHKPYAELLDYPAGYFGAFPHLTLSPASLCLYRPIQDKDFAKISAWLGEILRTFLQKDSDETLLRPSRLEAFGNRLAALLDCKAICSFSALATNTVQPMDLAQATGYLTAALLTAANMADGKSITALGEWLDQFGSLITLSFPCNGKRFPATLTDLSQYAADRGATFSFAQNESEAQIAFTVYQSELSEQNVKAYETPAPTRGISRSVIENATAFQSAGAIPLFHNGKWMPGAACRKKDDV